MKSRLTSIATVCIVLLFVSFITAANESMISIRLHELKELLQEMDVREGSIDTIGLVTTYETHKKLFENRINQDQADAAEFNIQSLANIRTGKGKNLASIDSFFIPPVLAMINLNRRLLGKPPISWKESDGSFSINMDLAYYYERNFQFKRAIELYDKSLGENLSDSIRAGVLLHQGYCYALSQQEDRARRNYRTVVERYGRENSAITATILLRYLEGFSLARERVLSGGDDSLSQGRQLVNLLDYKRALVILESVERNVRPEEHARIAYFKARCYDGMGETEKAADNYLKIVVSNPSSEYARWANRKVFMLGSRSGDRGIVDIAAKLNSRLKDTELDRMITEHRASADNSPVQQDTVIKISPEIHQEAARIISKNERPSAGAARYMVVFTSDGNTFRGTLVKETGEYIELQTSIGPVKVKKDRITRVSEK